MQHAEGIVNKNSDSREEVFDISEKGIGAESRFHTTQTYIFL